MESLSIMEIFTSSTKYKVGDTVWFFHQAIADDAKLLAKLDKFQSFKIEKISYENSVPFYDYAYNKGSGEELMYIYFSEKQLHQNRDEAVRFPLFE
ncbi:MAG: hypothetical protein IMY67_12310 [Bacteroidetes bacterium]|nr:hypothetical protein [Bacteroidota bacterium]